MNRKISGCFDAETGGYPVTFLPGFEVKYNSGHITVFKAAPAEAEAIFAQAEEDNKRRMDFFRKVGESM